VFCRDVLGQADLADDARFATNPMRFENREVLDSIVEHAFAQKTAVQVIALLDTARIANAQLNDVSEVSTHPFLRNTETQFGGMSVSIADLPLGDSARSLRDAPKLGADTVALRDEFRANEKGPAD